MLDERARYMGIALANLVNTFNPELIHRLSEEWKIPKNFMFIGSPGDHFIYGLAELGGVRLII